ncbi:MAG: PEP-CTERM sorting domain-containing protein [Proteobacteria bacterium]|nr:PEP-CTERM sorting domain-containing protein [Pseudomonadota bacterium]
MKSVFTVFLVCVACLLLVNVAVSAPLDLSTFTADPGVTESGGVVGFEEDFIYTAWYFYDDNFLVGSDATILSFDYDFQLGTSDVDDFLRFDFNFTSELVVVTNITGGHFEFDLSPYQGTEVSLAWGLIWDGDSEAGTTASVYNIDLTTSSIPIPEPSTVVLFGSGLIGYFGFKRRKKFFKSKAILWSENIIGANIARKCFISD